MRDSDGGGVLVQDLLRGIDRVAAALPRQPDAALRELNALRSRLTPCADAAPPPNPAEPSEELPHLTARERDVLARLALGERNKEIARFLGLRERTVKFHVANLLLKLGAQSRTEALRRALDLGLLARPDPDL